MMSTYFDRDHILQLIQNESVSFEDKALALYRYHLEHNAVYRSFVSHVRYNEFTPDTVRDIPFFPIELFKELEVKAGKWNSELIFYSSGTTATTRSKHHISDKKAYLDNARYIWTRHFGPLENYTFLSLLPSYHDNPSSSLLCMVQNFMLHGASQQEHYYLDDFHGLQKHLDDLDEKGRETVLFGVSFALLDYAENHRHTFVNTPLVIETGGMKKFRQEVTRTTLHERLKSCFSGARIISEYGMTECLSQMYCEDNIHFKYNDRMQIWIVDPTDPLTLLEDGRRGRICIIDLANIDTMPFIATSDLGIRHNNGVEILGRIDASDVRGCNYLIG